MDGGSPPTDGEGIVTPVAPSPSVLDPQEIGEWISHVGELVAVLVMVHNKQHAQVISKVIQYAASRLQMMKSSGRQGAWI